MNWIQSLLRRFGFGKRLPQMTVEEGRKICDDVDQRLLAHMKGQRLAHIARERAFFQEQLSKAIRQKTKRKYIYAALDGLKREEMAIAGDLP